MAHPTTAPNGSVRTRRYGTPPMAGSLTTRLIPPDARPRRKVRTMADGSGPLSFNFPLPQQSALRPGEIAVDLFAGGGGASEALKQALGVDPALAYNHDK